MVILGLGISNSAHAQFCNDVKIADSVLQEGSITSSFAKDSGGAELDVSSEGSIATVKLFNNTSSEPDNCENPNHFNSKSWSVSIASPLGEGDTARTLATLDDVSTGPSLTFDFGIGRTFGFDAPKNIVKNQLSGIEIAHAECLKKREQDLSITCKKPSINDDPEAYIAKYAPFFYSQSLTSKAKTFWVKGEATVGYDDITYLDITDLSSNTRDAFEYKVGISATYVSLERNGALTGKIEYQSSFDEADEAIICLPNTTMTDSSNCASGRPEEPERTENWLGSIEYRYLLREAFIAGRSLGVAPRVTYDFDDNTTGLSLPIFLTSTDSSGLTTGLNLGWRDDTDDFTAGIFIGGSFNLFE